MNMPPSSCLSPLQGCLARCGTPASPPVISALCKTASELEWTVTPERRVFLRAVSLTSFLEYLLNDQPRLFPERQVDAGDCTPTFPYGSGDHHATNRRFLSRPLASCFNPPPKKRKKKSFSLDVNATLIHSFVPFCRKGEHCHCGHPSSSWVWKLLIPWLSLFTFETLPRKPRENSEFPGQFYSICCSFSWNVHRSYSLPVSNHTSVS